MDVTLYAREDITMVLGGEDVHIKLGETIKATQIGNLIAFYTDIKDGEACSIFNKNDIEDKFDIN